MNRSVDDEPTQVIERYKGRHRHRDGSLGHPVGYHVMRALIEARVRDNKAVRHA